MKRVNSKPSASRANNRAARAAVAIVGLMLSTGCEEPQKPEMPLQQQIADQVQPVAARLTAQEEEVRAARREADERSAAMRMELDAARTEIQDLTTKLRSAQAELAAYEKLDLPALAKVVDAQQADLRRLNGEYTGFAFNTDKQFEDFKLIQANLEKADEDLRKLIGSSVTGLERRSEQARTKLGDELSKRFEEDRRVVLANFGELQQRVEASNARTSVVMQLIQEFLAAECEVMAAHSARLQKIREEMDRQFAAQGVLADENRAAEFFERARELHRQYLADPNRMDLLDGAILAYQKGLTARPDAADMHFELGQLLHSVGRTADARPHLLYYVKNGKDAQKQAQASDWLGES